MNAGQTFLKGSTVLRKGAGKMVLISAKHRWCTAVRGPAGRRRLVEGQHQAYGHGLGPGIWAAVLAPHLTYDSGVKPPNPLPQSPQLYDGSNTSRIIAEFK